MAKRTTLLGAPDPDEPIRPTDPASGEADGVAAPAGSMGLSVWVTAQSSGPVQRRGRYVPDSVRHPARMLPEIAAHAITTYTAPGDLVLEPGCPYPASSSAVSPTRPCFFVMSGCGTTT